MKIVFISVGALKKPYIKQGVDEYLSRIKRYFPVEVTEVRDEPSTVKMPTRDVLAKEGERIKDKLNPSDFIVALCEEGGRGGVRNGRGATGRGSRARRQKDTAGKGGTGFSSHDMAGFMERVFDGGKKRICFIVGGAFGLDDSVLDGADLVLSLSQMTMPHELARLVLVEQVYRALTIIRGEPYSH